MKNESQDAHHLSHPPEHGREAFEKWAKSAQSQLHGPSGCIPDRINGAWLGWQAAAAHSQQAAGGEPPKNPTPRCRKCGNSALEIKGYLHRVNEKGVEGIWECRPSCDANLPSDERVLAAIEGRPEPTPAPSELPSVDELVRLWTKGGVGGETLRAAMERIRWACARACEKATASLRQEAAAARAEIERLKKELATAWKAADEAQGQLDDISGLLPDESPHKHELTGHSLYDDVHDILKARDGLRETLNAVEGVLYKAKAGSGNLLERLGNLVAERDDLKAQVEEAKDEAKKCGVPDMEGGIRSVITYLARGLLLHGRANEALKGQRDAAEERARQAEGKQRLAETDAASINDMHDKAVADLRTHERLHRDFVQMIHDALDRAGAPTHHPDIGAEARKPMMPQERIAALKHGQAVRWIPVTERTPTEADGEKVLWRFDDGSVMSGAWDCPFSERPTHWASIPPLPAPPPTGEREEVERVPLGPEDVTPGSVIRWMPDGLPQGDVWQIVALCHDDGIYRFAGSFVTWVMLAKEFEIKRLGEDWAPCSKPRP